MQTIFVCIWRQIVITRWQLKVRDATYEHYWNYTTNDCTYDCCQKHNLSYQLVLLINYIQYKDQNQFIFNNCAFTIHTLHCIMLRGSHVMFVICVISLVSLFSNEIVQETGFAYVTMNHSKMYGLPAAMQQSTSQVQITVEEISRVQKNRGRCNLLIFGLGNDSPFWRDVNVGGKTIFVENSQAWIDKVKQTHGQNFEILKVEYTTMIERDRNKFEDASTWKDLLIPLPKEVTETKWDIVIVDAPAGFSTKSPGRWQSIYTAAQLRRPPNSLTVIDDCDRPIENEFGLRVFGKQNLKQRVKRGWRLRVAANEQCYFWK